MKNTSVMRVYVILIFTLLFSLVSHAGDNDEHEVKVVGDKNYSDNAGLVYDGIDVSNYQKDINWRATAADPSIKYVYVKATEGATHKQHRYRANIENARKHGVKVGSYHFLSTSSPIQKQFENFISMAKPEEQDLIPLLDVETHAGWSAKQLQDSVKLFLNLLEDYYGCKPMIYTGMSYFNTLLGYDFKNYPLFIARYSKSEPQLNFGAKWILWQFSDKGVINGIDERVDLSRFNRGYSLKDITYRPTNSKKRNDRPRQNVPRPKPKREEARPDVPYPPGYHNNMSNKERAEAQKRADEEAKKRKKQEEKRLEEQRKAQEKARKEEEKKRKEEEKKRKEAEKKRLEQEKKRLEQEKKQREQEEKQRREEEKRKARDNAQARMKADKDRTAQTDQQPQDNVEKRRKDDLESAKQERLASERSKEMSNTSNKKTGSKTTKKPSNQSSADNDEIQYNRGKKR
ncbi:MAG: glycoside hydrolase family 25 protein [Muribaculaceae bacterium]|nr:glycoside hydrolase family 25 protein [Muribaculaceae bacterium]